jgi:hypothetical protein
LAQGVNAGIGASGADGAYFTMEELGESGFEVALDRADIALPREAVEGRAVIGEIEPEVQLP